MQENKIKLIQKNISGLMYNGISYKQIINMYEEKILNLKNPELSFWFAQNIKGANIKAHGQVIIDSKDLAYNYEFAVHQYRFLDNNTIEHINDIDVKAHGQVIIDSKDLFYNYEFAKNVKGADIKSHGQIIIDSKDLEYNYKFARDVKGADVKAHGQIIIDSKNPEYNYKFAKEIKGSNKKAHKKIMKEENIEYNERIIKEEKILKYKNELENLLSNN